MEVWNPAEDSTEIYTPEYPGTYAYGPPRSRSYETFFSAD